MHTKYVLFIELKVKLADVRKFYTNWNKKKTSYDTSKIFSQFGMKISKGKTILIKRYMSKSRINFHVKFDIYGYFKLLQFEYYFKKESQSLLLFCSSLNLMWYKKDTIKGQKCMRPDKVF